MCGRQRNMPGLGSVRVTGAGQTCAGAFTCSRFAWHPSMNVMCLPLPLRDMSCSSLWLQMSGSVASTPTQTPQTTSVFASGQRYRSCNQMALTVACGMRLWLKENVFARGALSLSEGLVCWKVRGFKLDNTNHTLFAFVVGNDKIQCCCCMYISQGPCVSS